MSDESQKNSDESDLDKLRKRLYAEGETFKKRFKRESLTPMSEEVKTYWHKETEKPKNVREIITTPAKRRKKSKVFYISLVLFLAVLLGGIYFFKDKLGIDQNVVSSKNIEITVDGPSIVNAGVLSKWYVAITNNNKVNLELADLIADFPPNTLSVKNAEMIRDRQSIGTIAPGQTVRKEINAYLLGQKDDTKEIKISLEYRPEGSSAIFVKTLSQQIRIDRPPLGISINLPQEVESGQIVTLTAEIVSNSEIILKNLSLKMEYPPGFQYVDANFKPSKGSDTWAIGDLSPNEKRTLEIKGLVEGQDLTQLGFKAIASSSGKGGEVSLLGFGDNSVLIKKPFINFGFKISGESSGVVKSGSRLSISVPWKNNLPVRVNNAVITVNLSGLAIDRRSISVFDGFYKSQNDAIIWNASSRPDLKEIASGAAGEVKMSFNILSPLPVKVSSDKNFTFKLEGEIIGTRSDESGQIVAIKGAAVKEIKIASIVQLASRVLRISGPFSNYGPLPPKVGAETSYTIIWSVSNLYNDMSGIATRAALPSYMKWLNNVSTSSEKVIYDEMTGEIIWQVDKLEAGTGIIRPAREVAFQIALVPALNQVNTSPKILLSSFLEGADDFTGWTLTDSRSELTTELEAFGEIGYGMGKVVE